MTLLVRSLVVLILMFRMLPAGYTQQGHPLDGTWYGDWGPSASHRNPVVVVIRYDREDLGGLINPGPDSVPLDVVTLDHTNWTVRFEASARNREGETVRYVVEGRLEDLGLPNRSIAGTWSHGETQGDFRITRN